MSSVAPAPSLHWEVLNYFEFWPSKGPIILAIVLFSLAVITLIASTIMARKWYMLIAIGVGIAEIIGFGMRYRMLSTPAYGTYVAMQCLLIIPPSFLALVGYVTLGRVIRDVRVYNPDIKDFLKPRLITWLYFGCEIFSLALQGAGAGLSVNDDSGDKADGNRKTGKNLLLIGLAFLVVIIVTFLANAIFVHIRPEYGIRRSRNLSRLFYVLYVTTALLMIRNIFRLVEFSTGFYGAIARKEVYFYTLDSLMIVLILWVEGLFNFGFFLNGYNAEMQKSLNSDNIQMQSV